jgi:peptide/nickel transport system permease protein
VLWNTLQLTLVSLVMIFGVGMLIGIIQAVRQYSVATTCSPSWRSSSIRCRRFWFALMLILIFSLKASQWGWPIVSSPPRR